MKYFNTYVNIIIIYSFIAQYRRLSFARLFKFLGILGVYITVKIAIIYLFLLWLTESFVIEFKTFYSWFYKYK